MSGPANLAQAPNAVQPRKRVGSVKRGFDQIRRVIAVQSGLRFIRERALNDFELRLLPDPLIRMTEQRFQFLAPLVFHAVGDELLGFQDEFRVHQVRIIKSIEPAQSDGVPSLDPIRDEHAAIRTEFDVRGQDVPKELRVIDHFVTRSSFLQGKTVNAAARRRSTKIDQKKVVLVRIGKSGPRIMRDARRPAANMGEVGGTR